ncbi:MAG: hypothetical protein ACKKMV_02650 [Candidatus Nealsonbacteria bacterium]
MPNPDREKFFPHKEKTPEKKEVFSEIKEGEEEKEKEIGEIKFFFCEKAKGPASEIIRGMRQILEFVDKSDAIKIFGSGGALKQDKEVSLAEVLAKKSFTEETEKIDLDKLGITLLKLQEKTRGVYTFVFNYPFKRTVYGDTLTHPETGKKFALLFSTHYFEGIKKREDRNLAFRQLGRHETGHLLGLVQRESSSADSRGGIYKSHCLNLCNMKQSMNVKEVLDLAKMLEKNKIMLCKDCQQELKDRFSSKTIYK